MLLFASLFLWPVHSLYNGLNVWPLPQKFEIGKETASLVSQFQFSKVGPIPPSEAQVLDDAIARYSELTFEPHDGASVYVQDIFDNRRKNGSDLVNNVATLLLQGLQIRVTHAAPLAIGVDESYSLFIPGSDGCGAHCQRWATLNATTVWGALRGLETFSQIVTWEALDKGVQSYAVRLVPISIQDKPRFQWRGLLLDTSRHFLAVPQLKAMLDAMAYNKMNVFHWHLTDAESFPFQSKSRPKLNVATYSARAFYSAKDVTSLVDYAHARGIVVVPETDTPGHTASWGQGHPEILTDCWDWLRATRGSISWPAFDSVALDVTRNDTFDVVSDVVSELQSLFPGQYYHIGGDEVIAGCWNSSESITAWMRDNGYATNNGTAWVYDFDGLQHMWTLKMLDLLDGLNRTAIVWDEALKADRPLPNGTVVNVWTGAPALQLSLSLGYQSVMSYGYYLDRQAPLGAGANCKNIHWMFAWTWHDFYQTDPLGWVPNATKEQQELLLGAEVSSWDESVSDLNVQNRVWGRGPAAAERFWSPASVQDLDDAQQRMGRFWCRMQTRGVRAGPSMPGWCVSPQASEPSPPESPPEQRALVIALACTSVVLLVVVSLLAFDRVKRKTHSHLLNSET